MSSEQKPTVGDKVELERKVAGIKLYSHYGICTGDKEMMDLNSDAGSYSKKTAIVRTKTWEEFKGDSDDVRIHPCPKGTDTDKVVERAKSQDQQKYRGQNYHALTNNCETYATECQSGVASSSQADQAIAAVKRNQEHFKNETSPF